MYYCPNCKKKFRRYRRRCPICGGICRRNDSRTILLIALIGVLFLVLAGLIIMLCTSGDTENEPGGASSLSSSAAESTGTPETSVPPETTVPSTTAPDSVGMYTRAELEAMDTSYNEGGFGAGRAPNHARPTTPVSEQTKYAQYDAHFIGEDTNTVYLTFDCGYEYYATDENGNKYRVTEKILDVLKEKNVKAVFFVTMDYVKSEPDLVRRMISEGHAVGNHSTNHPVMPKQTIDKMEQEVMTLHNYVLENFGYKMTLFRPPTGAYSVQSLAVLQNLGYKTVLWSFQHFDYDPQNQPSEATALKTVTENAHNGVIYLLHAVSEANAAMLDDAIDYFRQEGYNIQLFS